jgi:hypothetical protein
LEQSFADAEEFVQIHLGDVASGKGNGNEGSDKQE